MYNGIYWYNFRKKMCCIELNALNDKYVVSSNSTYTCISIHVYGYIHKYVHIYICI